MSEKNLKFNEEICSECGETIIVSTRMAIALFKSRALHMNDKIDIKIFCKKCAKKRRNNNE